MAALAEEEEEEAFTMAVLKNNVGNNQSQRNLSSSLQGNSSFHICSAYNSAFSAAVHAIVLSFTLEKGPLSQPGASPKSSVAPSYIQNTYLKTETIGNTFLLLSCLS